MASKHMLRVRRWVVMTAFGASLLILLLAWVERGYAPRWRITSESMRLKGQHLSPLAFSPKGDVLAVLATPNAAIPNAQPPWSIRFLDASDGTEVKPLLAVLDSIEEAAYSPDGKLLAVLRKDGFGALQLEVFELATRKLVTEQRITYFPRTGSGGPEGQVTFRFSSDSSFIVWSGQVAHKDYSWSRTVGVLELATRKERFSLEKTWAAVASPDSLLLATIDDARPGDYDPKQVLKLWDAQSGELKRSIQLAQRAVRESPDFSPDGRLVAFSGYGTTTEVFDVATGDRVFERQGVSGQFVPKSQALMLVSGFDVQLWDTTTWQLKSSHTFGNLGKSFWNGDRITPWPRVVPNQPQVAVLTNHSQRYWPFLRRLGRSGQLNTFGTGQLHLLRADDGTRLTIELHEIDPIVSRLTTYGTNTIWSPDGAGVALSQHDLVVWDLPPQRSYVAPGCAAVPAVGATMLLLLLLRRKKESPESSAA